jgi:hypothetical protein
MAESNNASNASDYVNKDVALRSLLFAMVFYILSSPIVAIYINKVSPFRIEIQLVNAVLFMIIFYVISVVL